MSKKRNAGPLDGWLAKLRCETVAEDRPTDTAPVMDQDIIATAPTPVPPESNIQRQSSSTAEAKDEEVDMTATVDKIFGQSESDSVQVHSKYTCTKKGCTSVTTGEKLKKKGEDIFNHNWLTRKGLSYCPKTGVWWLAYLEDSGMYCLLCRKHNMTSLQNRAPEFNTKPSIRYKVSAISDHANTKKHKGAVQAELTSRLSLFEKQYQEREEVKDEVLHNAFLAAYWIAKEEVPNKKLYSLIELFKTAGLEKMNHFCYTSRGILREIFLILGDVVCETVVLSNLKDANCYGILTDEVTDISVLQLLVTFVQYVLPNGSVKTDFLFAPNLLENSDSADSATILSVLLENLEKLNIPSAQMASFVSDGASVMTGTTNGVAARLRREVNLALISVHCVCHRLALACVDTQSDINYISKVHDWLTSLWRLFEKSPKRLALYLKIQLKLKDITLNESSRNAVQRRLKKACTTRWLSFDNAVNAFHKDYCAIMLTLSALSEKEPKAKGMLIEFRRAKFLGCIYILHHILPHLSTLSKAMQTGNIHYSALQPVLDFTSDKLRQIAESEDPIKSMMKDIDPKDGRLKLVSVQEVDDQVRDEGLGEINKEVNIPQLLKQMTGVSVSAYEEQESKRLLNKYVEALKKNLQQRFEHGLPILNAFQIFDISLVPERISPLFQGYGEDKIELLAKHLFHDNQVKAQQLLDEYRMFKYHMLKWKPQYELAKLSQKSILSTPTLWCLTHLVQQKSTLQYEVLPYVAEVALSTPISNAWPERGASAVKRIKSRLRSSINTTMLNALLHISINGPNCNSSQSGAIVAKAVSIFHALKKRQKGKCTKQKCIVQEVIPSHSIDETIELLDLPLDMPVDDSMLDRESDDDDSDA